jgi:hypothetical protein
VIKAREIEVVDGTLQEIDVEAIRRERKREQARAETLEDLIAIGRQRGYKSAESWAKYVFDARQGKKGEYQSQR